MSTVERASETVPPDLFKAATIHYFIYLSIYFDPQGLDRVTSNISIHRQSFCVHLMNTNPIVTLFLLCFYLHQLLRNTSCSSAAERSATLST